MRNPANTRAMRFISFALVIAMVMCGISGIFSVANAEGETFTVDQVATMAKEVYEAGKENGFAETATIGSTTMDQPTYFILACKALLNIDNGATIANSTGADIALVNTAMAYRANPGNGDDSIPSSAENFTKAEYIYCAERQVAYTQGKVVEGTSGAPANYTTMPGSCPGSQLAGKAGYARQLTLVLAALASYKDNGTLPETLPAAYNAKAEFVPADPDATPVPTAGPSLGNFAMSAVVEAAAAIDLTAALPETVT
ncbi:MAG: hypothetical protein IJO48_06800, partial [Clostridia bacterium]|nr:hypothetical protein [Clostridia bacterium]